MTGRCPSYDFHDPSPALRQCRPGPDDTGKRSARTELRVPGWDGAEVPGLGGAEGSGPGWR